MKKLITAFFAITLFACIADARNFSYVYNDVTFKCKTENDGITITSFDNDADYVVIPGVIDGLPVKKLNCFINGNNYLANEIVIEDGVEEISKFCFNEFRRLRKVTLPSSITSIKGNAFRKSNDIAFIVSDGFNQALLRDFTSQPLTKNGYEETPRIDKKQEKLLAQKQKEEEQKQAKELAKRQKAEEDLDKAIARQQAELEKAQKEQEERELERKRQELLALQEATENAKKQNKKDKKEGGNIFSKMSNGLSNMFGGKDKGDKTEDAKTKQSNDLPVAEPAPLLAEEPVAPAAPERKLSDVDINIPKAKKANENTFCFIIANETYDELPTVNYAENDGSTFRTYCIDALGVPEDHVFFYTNASFTSMTRAFKKMENLAAATGGSSKFIFYYAGHGAPSEEDQSAFLVPSDGLVTVPSTCFKLADIYKRLGSMNAENVVVLLDACFSGLNRDNSGLMAARAVARKPKQETVSGNVIVLSATSEAETAMGYDEKGHGMFTYHLLKKLQQSGGNVKFGDLYKAVSDGVRRDSIIKNDKNQTPSLAVSSKLQSSWENLTL